MPLTVSSLRTRYLGASHTKLALIACALIVLGSFGGGATRNRGGFLAALHLEFLAYGHGAGFSNVTLWLGTVAWVLAWALVGRRLLRGEISLPQMQRFLLVAVAPLILAGPIMSRDVYSYLMQGALLRDGFDPYTQGPAANPGPLLYEVSHDWRNTTTPYGPLHLLIGKVITTLWSGSIAAQVFSFKVLSMLGFALIAWSTPRIATALGGNPGLALWLGVANPVMVFHLVGGMHNESIMVGLVGVGLERMAQRPGLGGFFHGVALVAIGMSLKATAAIVLPFAVWLAVRQLGASASLAARAKRFVAAGAGGAVITVAVLALVTWMSGASWGWIAALTGNTKVINPLAFPTLLAGAVASVGNLLMEPFPYNTVLDLARTVSVGFMGIGLLYCWVRFRRSQCQAVLGMAAAYMVAFFFNAVTLPWYYASVLPLVAAAPVSKRIREITTAASIVVAMAFTGRGNHELYNDTWMVACTVAAVLLTRMIFSNAQPSREATATTPPFPAPAEGTSEPLNATRGPVVKDSQDA